MTQLFRIIPRILLPGAEKELGQSKAPKVSLQPLRKAMIRHYWPLFRVLRSVTWIISCICFRNLQSVPLSS